LSTSPDAARTVLIWATVGRDAELTKDILGEENIEATTCPDAECVCTIIRRGPIGLLLAAEEVFTDLALKLVREVLLPRPSWSDLPILLITRASAPTRLSLTLLEQLQQMGSVTLLERPIRKVTLKMAVHAGLASRKRQYETRDFIAQLSQANTDLQQFAFAASHDLQEPLRMVYSYSQLLIERHIDPGNEPARQFGEVIKAGVRRMESLLQDLLTYSRVVHENTRERWARSSLETLAKEAVQLFQTELDAHHGTIHIGALPYAFCNPTQISAVFQNLISNAIKYAQPEQPPVIQIGMEDRQTEVVVWVRDNGIGFDPAYSERIFQLFQRLHNDNEIAGTGLGLSICRRIIERHGGRIWADSQPGKGSSFFFTLPKAPE
jgi:signal transduction histidine kinase